jgi:hypothetical protein
MAKVVQTKDLPVKSSCIRTYSDEKATGAARGFLLASESLI